MMSAGEGAEHPGYFFAFFHKDGEDIAGAGVVVLAHGGREVGADLADEGLVVAEQIGQRGLGLGSGTLARPAQESSRAVTRKVPHHRSTDQYHSVSASRSSLTKIVKNCILYL